MEILGYIGAILMGLSLGLIGGGGSILTVPILVYLFRVDAVLATAYSLFIVGLVSLVGSVSHIRQQNVEMRTAIVFGIPSIIAVFLTRLYLIPLIPAKLFSIGSLEVTKPIALLLLFAIIMLMASYSMLKKSKPKITDGEIKFNYPLIFLEGSLVGVVTGMVGAGGGFLIIPALVILANIPMKKAVGTSLLIIAAKSLIGFTGDVGADTNIDWLFLMVFSSISVVGILLGTYLSRFVSNEKLKPAFGWFVLVMGIYIISKELFFHA